MGNSEPTVRSRSALVTLSLLSLALVTTVNRAASALAPRWDWLPDSCIVSFLVCLGVYVAIRPARPFGLPLPDTSWRRVGRVSTVWLAFWLSGSAVAALGAGHWIRYRLGHTPAQLTGFLLFGPLQEELLFRGAVFELVERSLVDVASGPPIVVTTILFGLHHLQLHGFQLTPGALLQVGFALPLGLVLGLLRADSRSLWPGLIVHVLTNLPGAVGT